MTRVPHTYVIAQSIVPSYAAIESDKEREYWWTHLMQMWGECPRQHRGTLAAFPGANPVSLARAALPRLREREYRVALKSDGVRYMLMLSLRTDGSPVALMVDRARNMYEVQLVAPADHFVKGTLLEGELVWHQPHQTSMIFFAFDAIRLKGNDVTQRPFIERLDLVSQCIHASDEEFSDDALETAVLETDSIIFAQCDPRILLRPKRFVDRMHVARLWNERSTSEHRVDGLILQCTTSEYTVKAYTPVFKWKDHATVDLAGPLAQLRTSSGPLPRTLHDRAVTVLPSKVMPPSDGAVVEYLVLVSDDTFQLMPVRIRPDKTHPNSLHVVAATLQDATESIVPEELAE